MTEKIHTYCAMSKSRCGVVATVEDGRFVRLEPDADHPNRGICIKGQAAPELVYDPQRLRYPLRRTTPKDDPDPRWARVGWDEAMEEIAERLGALRDRYGAESVFFYRGASGGSASAEYEPWLIRFASLFGSPNTVSTGHICSWHKDNGSRYTYGTGIPNPDFEQTACILLWGHNPNASWPTQAIRISAARKRGARLIVIDPRDIPLARKADLWLKVRPGTDGLLALSFLNVMLAEKLYDEEFLRDWTNAGLLVRAGSGEMLTQDAVINGGSPDRYGVWEGPANELAFHDPASPAPVSSPALEGSFEVRLADGATERVTPVLELLKRHLGRFAPEATAAATGIDPDLARRAVRMFCTTPPACYYSYNGLEQHANAMQTNRAVCLFYSLTGNLDRPGGNVRFAKTPVNGMDGRGLLAPEQQAKRLGLDARPLGPVATGRVQAYEVYRAVLDGEPYPVKGFLSFGGDIIMANGDTLRGRRALQQLDLYVQTDFYETPAGRYADFLLPAATSWEDWHVKGSFDQGAATSTWLQYRAPVVEPQFESRSDADILFDLAGRMGFDEQFWRGDREAALNYMLEPSGVTVARLKNHPGGLSLPRETRYRKYLEKGFNTRSGLVEIYSIPFQEGGYAPLPDFSPSETQFGDEVVRDYPFTLTTAKAINFCHGQHRSLPSLRAKTPEPLVEINPHDGDDLGISAGEPVRLETRINAVTMKAQLNPELPRKVVRVMHGWWQGCPDLGLPGYDPFSPEGANVNLIIDNEVIDPITGSVPHRSYPCRVSSAA
ncbi:MAG: molybdopterin-dependent oxidoreductase [Deltaproteobacteria bacterium]|nr:molybdopterin-dependent oxidoreductase [Deltaproteobacteria bacterium]